MKKLVLVALVFLFLQSCNNSKKADIWMIGDSTMAKKSERRYPESGWGEGLKLFVKEDSQVHNHAASGRSTKSFIDEGRWKQVLDSLQKGDFVIIQFGHNDEKTDSTLHTDAFDSFKVNLKKIVIEARSKGAQPILCSSVVRRHFTVDGSLEDSHGDYIPAAKEAATETNTPYVDMEILTRKLVTELGPEKSKEIYNFTSQKQDSTHPNVKGAELIAGLFIEEVKTQKLKISKCFK